MAHTLSFWGDRSGWLTMLAYFGMSLFFALSGFVMQYNYGSRFAVDGRAKASGKFLLARFARLYPLYVVGLAISLSYIPNSAFFHHAWIALACMTLTQSWFNVAGATGDIIGGSWSISTEFFLYLIFIPAAASIDRSRRPLLWLIGVGCAGILAIGTLYFIHGPVSKILTPVGINDPRVTAPPWIWLIYSSPVLRAFEFFAGAFAARVSTATREMKRANRMSTRAIVLCILWIIVVIALAPNPNGGVDEALLPCLVYATTPTVVFVLILVVRYENFLGKILASPSLLMTGEISYSVYLLQGIVFVEIADLFGNQTLAGVTARLILTIAISTALAYGSYHLLELPMRNWIRSFGATLPKASVAAPREV